MHIFIIPLLVMLVTQGYKIIREVYNGTFVWSHINSYGGMPSSHAALATSLCYTIAHFESIRSAAFAVSLILWVVILRDAMGFRYQLGVHGTILNKLIKELPDRAEYKFPVLSERLGHTPLEVTVGFIFGIVGSIIAIAFFEFYQGV